MKNTVVPNDLDELSVFTSLGEPSSRLSTIQNTPTHASELLFSTIQRKRSYDPYAWGFLNSILDIVDDKLPGRAGQVQRIVSYLFFGGTAAVVNLAAFAVMFYFIVPSSLGEFFHNTFAYVVAAELSILANFVPNDRFTFKSLPGAQRPWLQRCIRFHATCIVGTILTYFIELTLTHYVKTPALIAEAVAIIIVLVYNFTAHHLFTYRHVKTAH